MSAQDTKARVLFLNIVLDGKVVQERAVPAGEGVTLGAASGATFVLPDLGLGVDAFELFAFRDGRYVLQATSQVKGKVKAGGDNVVLEEAVRAGSLAVVREGVFELPLTDADKGKLRVGPVTVLFKFVEPQVAAAPAPSAASAERFDFRPRWFQEEDDPAFLASLVIWLVLGGAFGWWGATAERAEVTLDDVPDRFTKIVFQQPETPKEAPTEDVVKDDDGLAVKEVKKAEQTQAPAEQRDDKPRTVEERKVDEAKKVEDARQQLGEQNPLFRELQARKIGTTGASGSGTVLIENADGNYDDVAERLRKAEAAGGAIGDGSRIRGSDGVPGGTGKARDIGGIEAAGDGSGGAVNLGSDPKVAVPKGAVTAGELDFDGGGVANVGKVVKRYQGQLTYCYEKSLKSNPALAGRVVVGWDVESGSAANVYIAENTTGDADLGECIVGKVRRWSFDGVEDAPAKQAFVFTRQD